MPDYEVTDPKSGKTLVISGPTPPTEAELTEIFSQFDTAPAVPKAAPQPKAASSPAPWSLDMLAQSARTTSDPAVGALKGVANTLIGAGEAAYNYLPGVSTVSDAVAGGNAAPMFTAAREMVQPTNTAQQIGYTGEQVGEFFLPLPGSKAKLAKEVLRSGLLTQAQTASTPTSAVSAGLTAAMPVVGKVAGKLAGPLKESAEKSVAQALGATKEWAKSEAAKVAPEMLARGVRGSRTALYERAKTASKDMGQRLEQAYQTAAASGATVPGLVVRGELDFAKDAFLTRSASGSMIPIKGTEPIIQQLDDLMDWVAKLPDDIPVDQAGHIKTTWDQIVAKAGLYGPKASSTATDSATAWTVREGAGSFRQLLNSSHPDIAALNKEYGFWKGLKDVLKETKKRTQAQSGGLVQAGAGTVFGGAGYATGDDIQSRITGAFVGAAAGKNFVKLVQSPWWRTSISGPLKNEMAKALASGSNQKATAILGEMMKALPSQARQALAN